MKRKRDYQQMIKDFLNKHVILKTAKNYISREPPKMGLYGKKPAAAV